MKFGHEILKYRDDILRDLAKLIAVPSVCTHPLPGKPFGEAPAQALECILSMAKNMGFETENTDNYAGAVYYGTGTEYVDVLAHVDVVPAGDGWDTDPFQMVIKDGMAYGRGVSDDKGAAIVALYCLKALKDAGIQGKYVLRTVFGSGEEIASDDLDRFYAKHPYPVMGFTPDCGYGICQCEKGILRLDFHTEKGQGSCVREFQAGLAVNAVPAKATAKICCTEEQHQKLAGLADQEHFKLSREGEITTILSLGTASHGAQPELGFNAASNLICLLFEVFSAEETGPLLAFLHRHIGMETEGTSLGIALSDEPSGKLSLNLGILEISETAAHASVDIRYPVTKDYQWIFETAAKAAAAFGLETTIPNRVDPLYIPEDQPLIQRLKEAYESATGEPCVLYSTGGGTYARHTNNRAVGFGPEFPGAIDNHAHNCNEQISLENFFTHAQICLEAMYLLFTK